MAAIALADEEADLRASLEAALIARDEARAAFDAARGRTARSRSALDAKQRLLAEAEAAHRDLIATGPKDDVALRSHNKVEERQILVNAAEGALQQAKVEEQTAQRLLDDRTAVLGKAAGAMLAASLMDTARTLNTACDAVIENVAALFIGRRRCGELGISTAELDLHISSNPLIFVLSQLSDFGAARNPHLLDDSLDTLVERLMKE